MGIFKKEKNGVKIALPEKFASELIKPISKGLLEIRLGDKIKVNKGWWAVFVLKDKPQDILDEGEWEVTIPMIPRINKLLKLDKSKVIKHGNKQELVFQDRFKCDLYFVSKDTFHAFWQTSLIKERPKQEKKFGVMARGSCEYRIVDPSNAVKLFLLEWGRIADGKAQVRLNKYINEFASEALEFAPCSSYRDLMLESDVREIIYPKVIKNLEKYGIEFKNFDVVRVEFSQEIMATVEQEKIERDVAQEKTEMSAEIELGDAEVEKVATRKKATVKVSNGEHEIIDFTKPDIDMEPAKYDEPQEEEIDEIIEPAKVKIKKEKASKSDKSMIDDLLDLGKIDINKNDE